MVAEVDGECVKLKSDELLSKVDGPVKSWRMTAGCNGIFPIRDIDDGAAAALAEMPHRLIRIVFGDLHERATRKPSDRDMRRPIRLNRAIPAPA